MVFLLLPQRVVDFHDGDGTEGAQFNLVRLRHHIWSASFQPFFIDVLGPNTLGGEQSEKLQVFAHVGMRQLVEKVLVERDRLQHVLQLLNVCVCPRVGRFLVCLCVLQVCSHAVKFRHFFLLVFGITFRRRCLVLFKHCYARFDRDVLGLLLVGLCIVLVHGFF